MGAGVEFIMHTTCGATCRIGSNLYSSRTRAPKRQIKQCLIDPFVMSWLLNLPCALVLIPTMITNQKYFLLLLFVKSFEKHFYPHQFDVAPLWVSNFHGHGLFRFPIFIFIFCAGVTKVGHRHNEYGNRTSPDNKTRKFYIVKLREMCIMRLFSEKCVFFFAVCEFGT